MTETATPLKVLIVEDSEDDARLLLRELRRGGYAPEPARVDSAAAMRAALADRTWDIIVSDYMIPGFGGLEALAIAKESGLDLPFILLSNKASEETLVEAMRAGATDFLMKDRLDRLGPVVKRELIDAAARRDLKQAQFEWRTAFDAVQDAIFIHDAEFRIVRANVAYAALGGLPVAQVAGKRYWEVFPKRAGPLPGCRSVTATGGMVEERIDCPDGTTYASRAFSVKGVPGKAPFSVHVIQDITERNRVQEALARSEKHFRALLEHASDLVAVVDANGLITYISPSVRQLGGYETDELMGRSYLELTHPEDAPGAANRYAELIRSPGALRKTHFRFRRKDGSWILLESVARNALADPLIAGVVINARDVTERERAERRTAALLQLSVAAQAIDVETLLRQGLDTMQQLTGSAIGFLHFVSEDQTQVELAVWSTDTLAHYFQAEFDRHYPIAAAGIWADCVRLKQPVVVNDYATAAGIKVLPQGHAELRRFISVPVIEDERVRMIVGVGNAADAYGNGDVETIRLFSQDLYSLVQRRRAEEQVKLHLTQLQAAFMRTVEVATNLSEMRDPYTAGHERRVADIAAAIGAALGLDAHRLEGLRIAGLLHDVGKITVPAEILVKPGRLTPIELELVQSHARASYDVLKDVQFPWPVAEVALQHHERMDGSGYPQGLKGDQIRLEARILAVADVVEAMASHRPYRPGLGIAAALAEIERGKGSAYDTAVADACLKLFRETDYTIPT